MAVKKRQTCEIQRCFREDNNKWSNTLVRISPWQLSIGQCIILNNRGSSSCVCTQVASYISTVNQSSCWPQWRALGQQKQNSTALWLCKAKAVNRRFSRVISNWHGRSMGIPKFLHFFFFAMSNPWRPGVTWRQLGEMWKDSHIFQEDSRDWKMLRVRKNSSREGENEEIGHEEGDSGSGKSGLRCNNLKQNGINKFSEKVQNEISGPQNTFHGWTMVFHGFFELRQKPSFG